jgi:hypothetical protein
MKIGKPVKSVPVAGSRQAGKFDAIKSAVDKLNPSEFLPVEMKDKKEAQSAYNSLRGQGYSVTIRGNTIYIRGNMITLSKKKTNPKEKSS